LLLYLTVTTGWQHSKNKKYTSFNETNNMDVSTTVHAVVQIKNGTKRKARPQNM